ncbi:hypothetical protein JKP88DRAFT_221005 [Tribonema minus]|uniref:Uncharacterized protein n=1 Tax=Tribonema minus TaxID=303371 RepID=A0A835YXN9_9STRA|nr:hypothetical protein JKP88DRAFT_221005 [Tribonema minus]
MPRRARRHTAGGDDSDFLTDSEEEEEEQEERNEDVGAALDSLPDVPLAVQRQQDDGEGAALASQEGLLPAALDAASTAEQSGDGEQLDTARHHDVIAPASSVDREEDSLDDDEAEWNSTYEHAGKKRGWTSGATMASRLLRQSVQAVNPPARRSSDSGYRSWHEEEEPEEDDPSGDGSEIGGVAAAGADFDDVSDAAAQLLQRLRRSGDSQQPSEASRGAAPGKPRRKKPSRKRKHTTKHSSDAPITIV